MASSGQCRRRGGAGGTMVGMKTQLRRAFVVVVAVSSLVACGGSDSGSSTTTDSGPCPTPGSCNPPADVGGDTSKPDTGTSDSPPSDAPPSDAPPGTGPTIGGCAVFPADNPWNQDVSGLPVDPNSASYLSTMNATKPLHPDWGAFTDNYGIPYVVVPASQPKVPISFTYASESDPGPYPIPATAPIEGGPSATGDRHVLVIQQGSCMLYEMFNSQPQAGGAWNCDSGAVFDLNSNKLRPEGWTSADAAGLPIFPGLARADEVVDIGEIKHALRFTMVKTQKAYVHPATHYASSDRNANLPPMGLRVRLKASFDITPFKPPTQVILKALKKYGMFVADNGSDWYITGSSDDKWTPTVMDALVSDFHNVHGSDFEVVQLGTIVKG